MQQMRFGDISDLVEKAKQDIMKGQKKQQGKEDMRNKELEEMKKRITDDNGIPLNVSLNLVYLYQCLAPGDIGLVSISNVKNFLETVVKPANPKKYGKMMAFFNVNRIMKTQKEEEREYRSIEAFLNSFRTIENAFMYSLSFRAAAISIAPKLEAPLSMSVVERVKWLKIWAILIMDQTFFWSDFNGKGEIDPLKSIRELEQAPMFPEIMTMLEKNYFRQLADGDVQLELIKKFLSKYPKEVQTEVLKFGEIGYNTPYFQKMQTIIMEIKTQLFDTGWGIKSFRLFTKGGIKRFEPEVFCELDKICKQGGIQQMTVEYTTIINPYNSFKNMRIPLYEYMELAKDDGSRKKLYITCMRELEMHIEVYRWLQRHPDFRFGKENKTIKEYEMEDLFTESKVEQKVSKEIQATPEVEPEVIIVTVEEAFTKWLYDFRLVNREEDIDWFSIKKLNLETKIKELEKYMNGEMLKEELFESLGFSNMRQAKRCVRLNKRTIMSDILLRPLKTF